MQGIIDVSLNTEFLLFAIVVALFIISLRIAYKNERWRSISILSACMLIIISAALYDYARQIDKVNSLSLYVFSISLTGILGLVASGLLVYGVLTIPNIWQMKEREG